MTKNNNEKQTHLDVHKYKPLQTFVDKHSKKKEKKKHSKKEKIIQL
jgi:hypothetical protein